MRTYTKKWTTTIDGDFDQVWNFFSQPENLSKLTPKYMNFKILWRNDPSTMYEGMLIPYIVSPLPGYRTRWLTEITHIQPGSYFIDEQRAGPYALWHHEHWFEKREGKVVMHDILHYAMPLGWLGRVINALWISGKIDSIFAFRQSCIDRLVREGAFGAH